MKNKKRPIIIAQKPKTEEAMRLLLHAIGTLLQDTGEQIRLMQGGDPKPVADCPFSAVVEGICRFIDEVDEEEYLCLLEYIADVIRERAEEEELSEWPDELPENVLGKEEE